MKISDNGVDRNMTEAEQTMYKNHQKLLEAEAQAQADAQTAKQVARQAVLDKLGLTADEAKTLFD